MKWIDTYDSRDERAGSGHENSRNGREAAKSIPALIALRDGRLFCGYGDRTDEDGATSSIRGRSWGQGDPLREDYDPDASGDVDLGYPRVFQSPDGMVNVIYYWADRSRGEFHRGNTVDAPLTWRR